MRIDCSWIGLERTTVSSRDPTRPMQQGLELITVHQTSDAAALKSLHHPKVVASSRCPQHTHMSPLHAPCVPLRWVYFSVLFDCAIHTTAYDAEVLVLRHDSPATERKHPNLNPNLN